MRYDDHVGGGGLVSTIAFWLFVGFCWLVVRAFSSWNAKVEKRKGAEREKKKAAEFKHWQEVEVPRRMAVAKVVLLRYGATPEERRKAFEKEAMTYVDAYEEETGFEKDVWFCYLDYFLYKCDVRETEGLPKGWRADFLNRHCPEGVQWQKDSTTYNYGGEHIRVDKTKALEAAEKEAKWRFEFAAKHPLS